MGSGSKECVELEWEWECLKETRKALLLRNEDGDEIWIPKSLLGDETETKAEGDKGRVFVQEWYAEQECLEVAE